MKEENHNFGIYLHLLSVISLTATNGSATDTFTPKDPLTGLQHGRTYYIADPSNSGNTIKLADSYTNATASTALVIDLTAQDGNSSDTFTPTDDMAAMEHGRTYYVIKIPLCKKFRQFSFKKWQQNDSSCWFFVQYAVCKIQHWGLLGQNCGTFKKQQGSDDSIFLTKRTYYII